jgi:1-acyl-sn-glycerol-3-phosphate acyltransferase
MPAQDRFLWSVSLPIIRGLSKAFFSLQVEYEAEPPPPPYVFAANHYSHFDSAVIGSVLDVRIRYLALEDLFGVNRLLDWLVEGYGAIPTPRYRPPVRAVRTALAALEAGQIVGLFPEATRVSHWGTLPPKRGAAWLALHAGVPLVPVAAIGTGRAFGLDNRLHRAPIRVIVGEALQPEGDAHTLTERWTEWMTRQIERYPESEVSGPRRAHYDGL